MSVLNPLAAFFKTLYGQRVTSGVTAITGISTKPLFTVTGGRVIITSLIGEVTTVIQAQTNAAKIVFGPDGAGADTYLCSTLGSEERRVGKECGITCRSRCSLDNDKKKYSV